MKTLCRAKGRTALPVLKSVVPLLPSSFCGWALGAPKDSTAPTEATKEMDTPCGRSHLEGRAEAPQLTYLVYIKR